MKSQRALSQIAPCHCNGSCRRKIEIPEVWVDEKMNSRRGAITFPRVAEVPRLPTVKYESLRTLSLQNAARHFSFFFFFLLLIALSINIYGRCIPCSRAKRYFSASATKKESWVFCREGRVCKRGSLFPVCLFSLLLLLPVSLHPGPVPTHAGNTRDKHLTRKGFH